LAHFALQKLHILPSVIANMDDKEKAFLFASTQLRIEDEKKNRPKGGK
jgi:hypothetical protein